MSRSSWKPLYIKNNFLQSSKNLNLKLFDRGQIISKEFLNNTIKIYNGIKFFEILVTEKMLGYKVGEFAPTRKIPLHKKKKLIKKKKK
jgi:small subunit ribosomal protein S19